MKALDPERRVLLLYLKEEIYSKGFLCFDFILRKFCMILYALSVVSPVSDVRKLTVRL